MFSNNKKGARTAILKIPSASICRKTSLYSADHPSPTEAGLREGGEP